MIIYVVVIFLVDYILERISLALWFWSLLPNAAEYLDHDYTQFKSLTPNLPAPTTVGTRINARNACAYIRRRSFGNADSTLLISECPICQHLRNHESIPVSYLCINT
jgi:hypothetical protein